MTDDARVEIAAWLVAKGTTYIIIMDTDHKKYWLPTSQIEILEQEDTTHDEEPIVKLLIPEWLAIKKGLA